MRFFQAERFGEEVGDRLEIRIASAASSPRVDPEAIVHREVSIERILAGDDVVKSPEAKTFAYLLRRVRVGDRASVGTVRGTGRRPEGVCILEHFRLQTGNRRTIRHKTLAGERARHHRGARTG
ncbi:MAG: hypothetical protein DMG14_27965 [Acidobacteria bacterium]|nr:MAG: hypothetical protein DMG14_27965 [Acidobacteriota bacterium]